MRVRWLRMTRTEEHSLVPMSLLFTCRAGTSPSLTPLLFCTLGAAHDTDSLDTPVTLPRGVGLPPTRIK